METPPAARALRALRCVPAPLRGQLRGGGAGARRIQRLASSMAGRVVDVRGRRRHPRRPGVRSRRAAAVGARRAARARSRVPQSAAITSAPGRRIVDARRCAVRARAGGAGRPLRRVAHRAFGHRVDARCLPDHAGAQRRPRPRVQHRRPRNVRRSHRTARHARPRRSSAVADPVRAASGHTHREWFDSDGADDTRQFEPGWERPHCARHAAVGGRGRVRRSSRRSARHSPPAALPAALPSAPEPVSGAPDGAVSPDGTQRDAGSSAEQQAAVATAAATPVPPSDAGLALPVDSVGAGDLVPNVSGLDTGAQATGSPAPTTVTPAALAPAPDRPTPIETAESDDIDGAPVRRPLPEVDPGPSSPRGGDRATDAPRSDDEYRSADAPPSVEHGAGAPHTTLLQQGS